MIISRHFDSKFTGSPLLKEQQKLETVIVEQFYLILIFPRQSPSPQHCLDLLGREWEEIGGDGMGFRVEGVGRLGRLR